MWGLQNDLTPRGEIGNDDDNGYEDVFFIDGGPIAGTVSSMDGYLYHVAYQGRGDMNHGNRRTQSGIQNFTHTGQIDLGFGPIMPAKKYPGRANWEGAKNGLAETQKMRF